MQRLLRDALQFFQAQNATLRGLQQPPGDERSALVVAPVGMVLEYLFEYELKARFETVSNRHRRHSRNPRHITANGCAGSIRGTQPSAGVTPLGERVGSEPGRAAEKARASAFWRIAEALPEIVGAVNQAASVSSHIARRFDTKIELND